MQVTAIHLKDLCEDADVKNAAGSYYVLTMLFINLSPFTL